MIVEKLHLIDVKNNSIISLKIKEFFEKLNQNTAFSCIIKIKDSSYII